MFDEDSQLKKAFGKKNGSQGNWDCLWSGMGMGKLRSFQSLWQIWCISVYW